MTLARFRRRARLSLALPLVALAYLAYAALAFDVAGALGRLRWDNAQILLGDFVSFKVEVIRDNKRGTLVTSYEGDARAAFPAEHLPDWVHPGAQTRIDLGQGHIVTYTATGATYDLPGYGRITITQTAQGLSIQTPGPLPDWISASEAKVTVVTPRGRLNYLKSRVETWRYFPGWEAFFFTPDSAFAGRSWGELLTMPRLDPATPNLVAMARAFWTNDMWHHGEVLAAMGQTVLMAFLGTVTAALVALPLAFLAARNLMPFAPLRFGLRRLFDFIRGTDALIWTLLLVRAFGPGPLTGALALLISDTGIFGKLYSEALENIDPRPIEGLRSTGAGPVQRARFAILPQIAPVFLAQVLYALESNTRSATLIGAIVGGGIGLLLTQAIQTQKDWEDVAYYLVLIVLTVTAMDSVSGWLRARLIKGAA